MAIFKAVKLKIGKRKRANLSGVIKYVLKDEKTESKLIYGQCLEIERAYDMMIETKKTFNKEGGREYFHFVQSFPPNEIITPEQALQQARKLLEATKKFRAYEVLVAVHKDREHIHTHFIVNSVSFVDGKKFHLSRRDLEELKDLQNKINIESGYSAAPSKGIGIDGEQKKEIVANEKNTYQLLKKAEKGEVQSYVQSCAISVLLNSKKATSKEEFIKLMDQDGFITSWEENKKHITFTDKNRAAQGELKCKIRLAKLSEYYQEFSQLNTKEDLINGFNINSRISAETNREIESGQHSEYNDIREELRQNRTEFINRGNETTDQGIDGPELEIAKSSEYSGENENLDGGSSSGGNTETIDFNSKFEEYADGVYRDRAEQAAHEAARREQERIAEEQRKARIAAERAKQQLQQQNFSVSENDTRRARNTEKSISDDSGIEL